MKKEMYLQREVLKLRPGGDEENEGDGSNDGGEVGE
tara:strand:+ start:1841 stop:1948 length:108 start_codon:yes stop_codon:yes gene_type:complete